MYKNSINYNLIYIGAHLLVILKKNNISLDKYYICYGFLMVYIEGRYFYEILCSVRNAYKCLSGSIISLLLMFSLFLYGLSIIIYNWQNYWTLLLFT